MQHKPWAVASLLGACALEAELQSLDERFESAQCPGPIPRPCGASLGEPVARCESGACALEWIEQP